MKILITGGGCREAIDGVRFVTNMSTGRTAAFLADALNAHGAEVTAIMGAGAMLPQSAAGADGARGATTAGGSECCGQTTQDVATVNNAQATIKADESVSCRLPQQNAATADNAQTAQDTAKADGSATCRLTSQVATAVGRSKCYGQGPQNATPADNAQTAQATATADGSVHCKLPPQSTATTAESWRYTLMSQSAADTAPLIPVRLVRYESGAELSAALEAELTAARARGAPYTAVIHAAAVSDFVPDTVSVGGATYRAGKALKKLHSGGDMTVTFRAAPKIADRLRGWAGTAATIFCFKLTNGATPDEQQKATDSLFAHSGADYVIKNDLTHITADQHPFAIAAADGTIAASGETLSDMARAVAALCKNVASSC